MEQSIRQPTDVKAKKFQYPVIQLKQFKSFAQIMDGSQLPSATNMDTQIGV